MKLINRVNAATATELHFGPPLSNLLHLSATGENTTTGWTHPQLMLVHYITPPADHIQDVNFVADEPHGLAGQMITPTAAEIILHRAPWVEGFRIHAQANSIVAMLNASSEVTMMPAAMVETASLLADGHVIVRVGLGHYEDSWQPTGRTKWPFHVQMKKLVHELELVAEGPDEGQIRTCIQQATAAGLVAAILAVLVTGGAALEAAIAAFLARLESCLGNGFTVRIDNHSHWEYWWT